MSSAFRVTNLQFVEILDTVVEKEEIHTQKRGLIKWVLTRSVRRNISDYQAFRKVELVEEMKIIREKNNRRFTTQQSQEESDSEPERKRQKLE